ncbi:4-amino-4-deoxy-L-arabinose transferase-like glycosyltransferase [Rhodanobacter sp. ANJX3]|uniref:ArnT family glycosyltransferase n=1 Tax=Rhodanobacter sp. ANJX3 TaxID=2723083 RepID=UPI00160F990C|nr:glycosyltransferase family 39 protein [Rhodanobacter sp. ANJX3]MBB5360678.1 4-amino-4-deoxy-L-arabinose transferase-like glycosyltransferase [Rhodanobacter sp. ANJX3]
MNTLADKHRRSWRWLAALTIITLLALAMRWYYAVATMVSHPVIRGDAAQYFSYAWNLVHHSIFSNAEPSSASVVPNNYRDPGYPFFLAILLNWLGPSEKWYESVLFCQALMGALTVGMATQLGRYWLSPNAAICAGLLMALWPHSITTNGVLLSETLFGFLCTLSLLLCAQACRQSSMAAAALTGFILGAAALTNAILLPFGVLLGAVFAWRKLAPWSICIALMLGAAILPGVWAIRNAQIPAPTAGSSSMDRALENFVIGSAPSYQPLWRQQQFASTTTESAAAHASLSVFNSEYEVLSANHVQGARIIAARFSEQPLRYVAWYFFQKPCLLWGWDILIGEGDIYVYRSDNSPFKSQRSWIALEAICHALNPLLMLLAFGSLPLALSKKLWITTFRNMEGRCANIVVASMACFVTFIYCTLQAEPRYSIPFRPLEVLLAVTTVTGLVAHWQEYRRCLPHPVAGIR